MTGINTFDPEQARRICDDWERMESDSATVKQHLREVAQYVMPAVQQIQAESGRGGLKTRHIYDTTAIVAATRLPAVIEGLWYPKAQKYQHFRTSDKELNKLDHVRGWFDTLEDTVFETRYSRNVNFSSSSNMTMTYFAVFGTAAEMTMAKPGLPYYSRAISPLNINIMENDQGIVDTVYRLFDFTHYQAQQAWKARAPQKARDAKNQNERFKYVQLVRPNGDYDERRVDRLGKKFTGDIVCIDTKEMVDVGGFETMPIAVPRMTVVDNEVWGRSPGTEVLPSIRTANAVKKTLLQAGHFAVRPPVFMFNDNVMKAAHFAPGTVTVGGVNAMGQPLVHQLAFTGRLDFALTLYEMEQKQINDAFMVTLFEILTENGGDRMTATQVLERAQEKSALLSPLGGRVENEYLAVRTEREIDILIRQGRLPPMPGELIEARGDYTIEYDNPMTAAQRASEATNIIRFNEILQGIAAIKPDVLDAVDFDAQVAIIADVLKMRASTVRDAAQIADIRAQRAEQQQAADTVNALPQIGKAVKDLAQVAA